MFLQFAGCTSKILMSSLRVFLSCTAVTGEYIQMSLRFVTVAVNYPPPAYFMYRAHVGVAAPGVAFTQPSVFITGKAVEVPHQE